MKKQIKVAYFPSYTEKNKVLGSNGKSLDKYCIKCEPDEDLSSGNYILDATFLIEDNLQDLLQEEVILKVLVDYGYEIFRISKVTVGTRYIDVVARQITIADSLTLWLEDVRPTNLNGQAAVSWMLDNAEGRKEIQIVSDIDAIATAYYQRMSLYKALHDNDNSFLNRWGGEVQRRGYTIYINKRIGRDRGFSIREGKNLTGFKGTSNIDNLVTRARGQGYNGILGNYIDSSLIGAYNRIYTSVIKYDDVKVKDEYNDEGYDTLEQAQAELDRRIEEEFSKNDIDKIKASYIINFVQLEKTEEYKNYVVAERLFIGDTSRVYIPKLNVDIKVRAMSKKYDVLAQKTKEIKLSNYIEVKPLSIKQIVEKLETMDSTETILQLAKDNATSLIKGGLKNSYVIVRENEIIIGDTKDINTMINVWRFNNGGLGHSKTGYYGEFGTAITQDGQIVADFITTGVLNAGLIKTGLLKSFNGVSWINLDNGTFDYANGNLSYDGLTMQIIGKIINVLNGYGVEMDQGGLMFATNGEVVGGIRSSKYNQNNTINGLSIVNTRDGDYIDIGFTESEDFEGNTDFYPVLRISKIVNQLLGNFKGIQLLENTRLANMKTFYLESNDSKCPHEIYNTAGGLLALFGDNGTMLGYIKGSEKVKVLEIVEAVGEAGVQAYLYKNLSMAGNKILGVSDIFTGTTSHRYHHDGWCGSIEATAKRISNLNVFYDSGWYAYSSGSNGAPSSYGVILHLKWGETDFVQIAFDFANTMYQRAWVNGTWTNWTQR
jgi:phage minor structural protein